MRLTSFYSASQGFSFGRCLKYSCLLVQPITTDSRLYNITTADDLTACLQQAENEVTQLAKQRTILNVRKKKHKKLFDALAAEAAFAGFEPRKAEYDDAKEVLDTCGIPREALLAEKADLYEQLAQVNQQIRQERWKLKQCKEISETAAIMQRDIDRVEQQPQRIADTHQR